MWTPQPLLASVAAGCTESQAGAPPPVTVQTTEQKKPRKGWVSKMYHGQVSVPACNVVGLAGRVTKKKMDIELTQSNSSFPVKEF